MPRMADLWGPNLPTIIRDLDWDPDQSRCLRRAGDCGQVHPARGSVPSSAHWVGRHHVFGSLGVLWAPRRRADERQAELKGRCPGSSTHQLDMH